MPDVRYECAPPNLHFFDHASVDMSSGYEHFANVLTYKDMASPEEGVKKAWYGPLARDRNVADLMLEYARNVIEEEGPFHGVIGSSEGGGAAATVLFEQLERARESGQPCTMQCGIFFVSTPPFWPDGKTLLLCDDGDDRITVPTCHIFSETDQLGYMSRACANVCQDKGKTFVLHEGGHTIPHTEKLMVDVAEFVRRVNKGTIDDNSRVVRNAATA